ncbi:MAG: MFS transporter [Ardenticatenaceae bacterium]|nr:MFS transporter [Ardenticatenaceae bacterium]
MTHVKIAAIEPDVVEKRKIAFGVTAVFITQFVSFLFINARNIAQPQMIAEFEGIALFAWLIALPALSGSISTLLLGKLSDIYGRRVILLLCIAIFLLGLGLTTQSTSMLFLVAAATFMSIGHFPIVPFCFAAIGDLFDPSERAKWTGLLNLPIGVAALIGPALGGVIAESAFGWRGLYWGIIPLMLAAGILVAFALPRNAQLQKPKIDWRGAFAMAVATTTLIIGVSRVGVPGQSAIGALLLFVSLIGWLSFIQIEKRAEAPILDPQVLFNRTFLTAASTGMLSFFGIVGIVAYSPIFVQDVMQVSPTLSGSMLTPYTVLVAFMGIPAGFLIAKTQRYRWMYLAGYPIVTLTLFAMWRFTASTPIWLYILVTAVAGFGLGVIPTVNTIVAQFAVPRRLLGVAVGAIFFFQMIGIAVAPAILGLAQSRAPDLEGGLKLVFLVGAVTMTISTLLITTIPEISVGDEAPDKAAPHRLPFPTDIDMLRKWLAERDTFSILETVDIHTGQRTTLREFDTVIEAPNWSNDGRYLIYNSRGRLYTYELATGEIGQLDTGFAIDCNNDHLLSPDNSQLAISHFTNEDATSRIYMLPVAGGVPTLITEKGPSYLHGWSPDGKRLVYCGERNGQYDVYAVSAKGGPETQLTDEPGLDDGPEYSPSGEHIWFNSVRGGLMQIWRMEADGSHPTHIIKEEANCWFPHVSPDGKWVAYIAYSKDDVAPGEHPPNKDIEIRLIPVLRLPNGPAAGGDSKTLVRLFGGQGTMNVNSWSPDGRMLAFVSYRLKE